MSSSVFENLLSFLRNDERDVRKFSPAEWIDVCRRLSSSRILACAVRLSKCEVPHFVRMLAEKRYVENESSCKERLAFLKTFSEAAHNEDLHYIVLKGILLSNKIYEDPFLRDSSDIDLLVRQDDIPKADYILRKTGCIQPGEETRLRKMLGTQRARAEVLEELQAPYPLRTNDTFPHVMGYYFLNGSSPIVVEVHDRHHGLDELATPGILWNLKTSRCHGQEIPTCSTEYGFLLLALSAYEDSETFYCNTGTASGGPNGTFALKAYFDLAKWIQLKSSKLDFEKIWHLAQALGADERLACAVENTLQLFPELEQASLGPIEARASRWGLSYPERLTDYVVRVDNGMGILRKGTARMLQENAPTTTTSNRLAFGNGTESPFAVEAQGNPDSLSIIWTLPTSEAGVFSKLVFQSIVLFPCEKKNGLGIRVNLFNESNAWVAWGRNIEAGSVYGHGSRRHRDFALPVEARNAGAMLRIELRIPSSKPLAKSSLVPLCSFAVYEPLYGHTHRRIAGEDHMRFFEQLADRAQEKNGEAR